MSGTAQTTLPRGAISLRLIRTEPECDALVFAGFRRLPFETDGNRPAVVMAQFLRNQGFGSGAVRAAFRRRRSGGISPSTTEVSAVRTALRANGSR